MCYNRYKKIKQCAHLFLFCIAIHSILLRPMEPCPHLPVVVASGVGAGPDGMLPLIALVKKHMTPNVHVVHVNHQSRITSAEDMFTQGEKIAKALADDPLLANGFNVLAHSQGGLATRYFLQRYNNPPVYNYISLGSPQRGVCGIPSDIDEGHPWIKGAEGHASTLLYTRLAQEHVSFADYWNDSLHHEEYLEKCLFLPYLNNEKNHYQSPLFKENICKLKNMVLVKSAKEYIVEPAISCHFGFYKEGSMTETESLFESDIYKNDTLGLKILHESGRLHFKDADCYHTEYEIDEENFINNVLPFLLANGQEKSAMEDEEQTQLYNQ